MIIDNIMIKLFGFLILLIKVNVVALWIRNIIKLLSFIINL